MVFVTPEPRRAERLDRAGTQRLTLPFFMNQVRSHISPRPDVYPAPPPTTIDAHGYHR